MNLIFPVSGDNYGGVDRFWFAHEDDISHVDDEGQIILKEDTFWNLGKTLKYGTEFQNPSQDKRGGVIFNSSLTGTVKKYRPELEEVLQDMRGERYALIYKDQNGYLVQVGRPGELLTFTTEQLTGGMPFDNNGFRWAFRGQTTARPVNFLMEIPVDPTTPSDPITGAPVKIYLNDVLVATVPAGGSFYIDTEFTIEYRILP